MNMELLKVKNVQWLLLVKNRNIVEKKMSKQQIEKAQELARNWKPRVKKKSIFEQLRETWDKVTK